jgi:hypothetical protein
MKKLTETANISLEKSVAMHSPEAISYVMNIMA